jgi:hypothetical protein
MALRNRRAFMTPDDMMGHTFLVRSHFRNGKSIPATTPTTLTTFTDGGGPGGSDILAMAADMGGQPGDFIVNVANGEQQMLLTNVAGTYTTTQWAVAPTNGVTTFYVQAQAIQTNDGSQSELYGQINTSNDLISWSVATRAAEASGCPVIHVDTTDGVLGDITAAELLTGGWDFGAISGLSYAQLEHALVRVTEVDGSSYYPTDAAAPLVGLVFGLYAAGQAPGTATADAGTTLGTVIYLFAVDENFDPTSWPAPYRIKTAIDAAEQPLIMYYPDLLEFSDFDYRHFISEADYNTRGAEFGLGLGYSDLGQGLQAIISGEDYFRLGRGDGSTIETLLAPPGSKSDRLPPLPHGIPENIEITVGGIRQPSPFDQVGECNISDTESTNVGDVSDSTNLYTTNSNADVAIGMQVVLTTAGGTERAMIVGISAGTAAGGGDDYTLANPGGTGGLAASPTNGTAIKFTMWEPILDTDAAVDATSLVFAADVSAFVVAGMYVETLDLAGEPERIKITNVAGDTLTLASGIGAAMTGGEQVTIVPFVGSQTAAGDTVTYGGITTLKSPYVIDEAGQADYATAAASLNFAGFDLADTGTSSVGVSVYWVQAPPASAEIVGYWTQRGGHSIV